MVSLRTLSLHVKVPSKITSFTLILFYSVYFVSLELYFIISVYLLYVLSCWQTLISGLNWIIIYVVSVSFWSVSLSVHAGLKFGPGPEPPRPVRRLSVACNSSGVWYTKVEPQVRGMHRTACGCGRTRRHRYSNVCKYRTTYISVDWCQYSTLTDFNYIL
jgi:hypothetical protein